METKEGIGIVASWWAEWPGICVLLIWALTIGFATSCSTSGTSTPSRIVRGDTTIVRSGETGVWERPRTFVEEMTIGELDGPEELMFGSIYPMAVDNDGGIYAFDEQVPALRYFNSDGEYVRTLGGKGQGPGEYQDMALGLAVLSDGRIVMRDPRNWRLNIYNPDGTPSDHWALSSSLFTNQAMFTDIRDHIYLKILLDRPEPNSQWKIGLLHLDERGAVVDTIPSPIIPGKAGEIGGRFRPKLIWTWSPLGYAVVGFTDRYSFELRKPDGKVVRIERDYEPVRFASEERAQWAAVDEWYQEYQNVDDEFPPIPSAKPPFSSLRVDQDGRIWVRLHQSAEKQTGIEPHEVDERTPPSRTWREPEVYDVFSPDGTYLGVIRVPEKTSIYVIRGEHAWGVRTGEMGEPYIVRLRMEPDVG